MKNKFLKITNKEEFLKSLANTLNIKVNTLRVYIYEEDLPVKTKHIIEKAIDLQLEADAKKRLMDIEVFDAVAVLVDK